MRTLSVFAVCLSMFVAGQAHAGLTAYATVVGQKSGAIDGGVTEKGREKTIAVLASSHEIVSPRDPQSGLPTGQRMHKPFVITTAWDKSTAALYNVLCTNENLKTVTIDYWGPELKAVTGGATKKLYSVRLTNANIADISMQHTTDTSAGAGLAGKQDGVVQISMTYQKIEWTWVDGGGSAGDSWNARVQAEPSPNGQLSARATRQPARESARSTEISAR